MNEYQRIISDFIQGQMGLIGPGVTLSIARKIPSLKIADSGEVLHISGDPKTALGDATEAFTSIFGEASRMILRAVMQKHPDTHLEK